MSVFGSIMSKIFHHPAAAPADSSATSAQPASQPPQSGFAEPVAGSPTAAPQSVDVGAVLSDMATKAGRPSNYKTSIVDLMTLLGLDSSLGNRKALAGELGYTGNTDDTAPMNIWLHKQVMTKLSENGGKVPADLMA